MASCLNSLIGIWHTGYFFFTFCPALIWKWETSLDWKMLIRWCRTDNCSCKLSEKVSLMLGNPFLVPCFCKLNYISVSSRLARNHLQTAYSLRLLGKAMLFLIGNKCNIVKGQGIIYTNDVIKKLIDNIKNVRKCTLHKFATFSAVLLSYCIYC